MLTNEYLLASLQRKRTQVDCPSSNFLHLDITKTMSGDQYVLQASTSGCKKHSLESRRTLSSNCMAAQKSSVNQLREDIDRRSRKAEIREIEGRLRILEEEAEMLRGALLESVEESTKLITEINQHFHTIQHCLIRRELDRGELYSHRVQMIPLLKDRTGLLQVLIQESNPSIVRKGSRTKH